MIKSHSQSANYVFALTGWGQKTLHKNEDGLIGAELDPLSDHVHKLTNS